MCRLVGLAVFVTLLVGSQSLYASIILPDASFAGVSAAANLSAPANPVNVQVHPEFTSSSGMAASPPGSSSVEAPGQAAVYISACGEGADAITRVAQQLASFFPEPPVDSLLKPPKF